MLLINIMVKRKSLPVRYPRKTLRLPKRPVPTETTPKYRKPTLRTPTIQKPSTKSNPKISSIPKPIRKPDPVQPKEDNTNAYLQKPRSDLVNPMLPNITRSKMK